MDSSVGTLAELQNRLSAYAETGEPSLVLDDDLVRSAKEMAEAALGDLYEPDGPAADAVEALARLHWFRFLTRGFRVDAEPASGGVAVKVIAAEAEGSLALVFDTGGDEAASLDIRVATELFALIRAGRPHAVPPELDGLCNLFVGSIDLMARLAERRATDLVIEFGRTGEERLAVDAIGTLMLASTRLHLGPQRRAELMVLAGEVMVEVFELTHDVGRLALAERVLRRAIPFAEGSKRLFPVALITLGRVLTQRALTAPEEGHADEAVMLLRRAVESAEGSNLTFARGTLGATLVLLPPFNEDVTALDEAITLLRVVVETGEPGSTYVAAAKGNLAVGLALHANLTGRAPEGPGDPLALMRASVLELPEQHPQRVQQTGNLAAFLRGADHFPEGEDLDRTIDALQPTGTVDGSDPALLCTLAGLLHVRYLIRSDPHDLDRSITLQRTGADHLPPHDDRHLTEHLLLGEMLGTSYMDRLDDAAMDEAMRRSAALMAAHPPGAAAHREVLAGQARMLDYRYSRTGEVRLLRDGIEAHSSMLAGLTPGTEAYDRQLSSLASALVTYEGDVGPSARLGDVLAEIQDRNQDGHDRAELFGDVLARALYQRWERSSDPGDLETAIAAARASVAAAGDDFSARATGLTNLGGFLREQFSLTGDLRQLDEAIELTRQALVTLPADHPGRANSLGNLATALQVRYLYTEDGDALDEAIESAAAVDAMDTQSPVDHCVLLATLGGCLLQRARRTRSEADLHAAIAQLRRSVAMTSPTNPRRARHLNVLAAGLTELHERTGDPRVLDEAEGLLSAALAITPAESPFRAHHLNNLAGCYLRKGDAQHVETAVELLREALGTGDRSRRVQPMSNLAQVLITHFGQSGDEDAAMEAVSLMRGVLREAGASVRSRIEAAWRLGAVGAERGDASIALEGYASVVSLMELAAWRGLSREDRERQVGRYGRLTTLAAAWAIEAGEPQRAVELLELGRAILLRQAASGRERYDELAAVDPDIARRLAEIQARLDVDSDASAVPADIDTTPLAARRDALLREWNTLVDRVRRIDGFANFLAPPGFDELRPRPGEPPVVVVNVSELRCDALIVDSDGVTVVPLPGLRSDELNFGALTWELARQRLMGESGRTLPQLLRARASIAWVLRWLWDRVADPILTALGITGPPHGEWPRIRWCPTGRLTDLPLHAAGHHETAGTATPLTVLDRAVSTYVTTLRGLYTHWRVRTGDAEPMLVAMARTPGRRPLRGVTREMAAFTDRFDDGLVLYDDSATRKRLFAGLRSSSWVHFACHAEANPADPSSGRLVLHDGPVRVSELRALAAERGRGELALLLACETARRGGRLADEGISLATAMQIVGFRSVIGTMWGIDDEEAADAAIGLYQRFVTAPDLDSGTVARALHHTILQRRAAAPQAVLRWAGLIHLGDER